MTIHQPCVENMVGDVPTFCPHCRSVVIRSGLSDSQKQFLIDTTYFHDLAVEQRHLATLDSLLYKYPGTQNSLLRKNAKRRTAVGPADESAVSELLDKMPEFRSFLMNSDFELDARYPWVKSVVLESSQQINALLVSCQHCNDQYVILPFDYFHKIG